MKISGVVITYNEEKNIGKCIDSFRDLTDEIIVVDSFSTDRTEMICREKGAKFIQHKFEGHIEQKNFAISQASNDWILSLDADEQLSPELIRSIREQKEKQKVSTEFFQMNRLNNYCGKWIKHGIWYPDKKIRLWNKQNGSWGGTNPHDKVIISEGAKVEFLNGDILHFTVSSRDEYFSQQKKFALLSNQERKKRNEKNYLPVFIRAAFAFFRSYILRAGFLDGTAGYDIARGFAYYTKVKYS
ncbi:MAG TPA: glycosyltransferase family 2 protein [Bacteroidetes bacterium]|nr:glycosyltransferase family 2 protein [Bacteroidota bacterium]